MKININFYFRIIFSARNCQAELVQAKNDALWKVGCKKIRGLDLFGICGRIGQSQVNSIHGHG